MDALNFDSEELLIMEGSAFLDFDLHPIMNEHYLTRSTLTSVVQEINLKVKPEVEVEDDSHEIFGFCELPIEKGVL